MTIETWQQRFEDQFGADGDEMNPIYICGEVKEFIAAEIATALKARNADTAEEIAFRVNACQWYIGAHVEGDQYFESSQWKIRDMMRLVKDLDIEEAFEEATKRIGLSVKARCQNV